MLRIFTMKLIFIILPIIFADEIIFSYKLNFNFGLKKHMSLSQKETAILLTTVCFTGKATVFASQSEILNKEWIQRQWNHVIGLFVTILKDFYSSHIWKRAGIKYFLTSHFSQDRLPRQNIYSPSKVQS